MTTPSRLMFAAGSLVTLLLLAGCPDTDRTLREADEKRKLELQVQTLQRDVSDRDRAIRDQAAQIQKLQQLGPERLRLIPYADRIELDSLTGGYDDEHNGSAQGVVVYLRPLDSDGDPIKAPGTATVQVLDLANPPDQQLVCECKLEGD